VHNNGPKIDNSLQGEALFQPFMTKRAGGSGLGLAIVRRIVDAHGGHIQHRADTDWPVTFELTLPQHSAHSRLGNPSHDAT
jgi:nitrogen-specific signal transduction histidine kinase